MALEGLAEWKRDLRKAKSDLKLAMAKGLIQAADDNMEDSLEEAPEDTRHMKDTAYVDKPVFKSDRVELTLGYEADYAIYVHEIMDYQHQPPTKAKFLEDPITRNAGRSEDTIDSEVRKVFR